MIFWPALAASSAGSSNSYLSQDWRGGIGPLTSVSVSAIGEVVKVIERIDGFASAIAASVEEQAATVRDIARNASEVASAVGSVVDNISGVAEAAKEAERNAALTQIAATKVSNVAVDLEALFKK